MTGDSRRDILDEYVLTEVVDGRNSFKCKLCGKVNNFKHHTINHLESVHFPDSFSYDCDFCGKHYNSKNGLSVHISTKHRAEKLN